MSSKTKKEEAAGPGIGDDVLFTELVRPDGEPPRKEDGTLNRIPVLRPAKVIGSREDGSLDLILFGLFPGVGTSKPQLKAKKADEKALPGTAEAAGCWHLKD